MSICHTCVGQLSSGHVHDLRTGQIYSRRATSSRPVSRPPPAPSRSSSDRRMTMPTTALLTPVDVEEFGRELDRIREEVIASLGEKDAAYIRRVIAAQR